MHDAQTFSDGWSLFWSILDLPPMPFLGFLVAYCIFFAVLDAAVAVAKLVARIVWRLVRPSVEVPK